MTGLGVMGPSQQRYQGRASLLMLHAPRRMQVAWISESAYGNNLPSGAVGACVLCAICCRVPTTHDTCWQDGNGDLRSSRSTACTFEAIPLA